MSEFLSIPKSVMLHYVMILGSNTREALLYTLEAKLQHEFGPTINGKEEF